MTSRTPFRTALAVGAAAVLATTAVVASGAAAAANSPTVSAGLDHSVVRLGSSFAMKVGVSPNSAGQTVYLQQSANGQWHNLAKATLGSSSSVIFHTTARTGGNAVYRVYQPAQRGHAAAASVNRTVHVQTLQQITVADFSSRDRVWNGPRVYIPGATYQVDWANSCVGPHNGLIIDWNGDNSPNAGWETYYGVDNPAHSGSWTGHKGARSGNFSVSSPCRFTLHVTYQGWR